MGYGKQGFFWIKRKHGDDYYRSKGNLLGQRFFFFYMRTLYDNDFYVFICLGWCQTYNDSEGGYWNMVGQAHGGSTYIAEFQDLKEQISI